MFVRYSKRGSPADIFETLVRLSRRRVLPIHGEKPGKKFTRVEGSGVDIAWGEGVTWAVPCAVIRGASVRQHPISADCASVRKPGEHFCELPLKDRLPKEFT